MLHKETERVYFAVGTALSIRQMSMAVPLFRRSIACLALRRPGLDARSVHVRFVVKPENYEQSSAASEIRKQWIEKCLRVIFQISVG